MTDDHDQRQRDKILRFTENYGSFKTMADTLLPPSFDVYAEKFIIGFVMTRTEGSRSRSKLPTRNEITRVAEKYFSVAAVNEGLDKALADGRLIQQDCYIGTRLIEIL